MASPTDSDTHLDNSLGLPATGIGSLASNGRRTGALAIDWFVALGISAVGRWGTPLSSVTLLVWVVLGIAAVVVSGCTVGQYVFGLRVRRIDTNGKVGLMRAAIRSVLLAFVIPGLFTDRDGRGMHDRASNTAVVRTR
ncbi:RDD family protein [Skermania piniformis]|uniref:RDD family protein n=1 Tax=Skermania pinensis TaxID=39122 RepID=A0ABX8SEJ2_9ACTN|nr:RDD family protein [Skermania piniformis]QXQ15035.1 RDD family protein [Skermania piniformis]